jgi:hypothetical protein
MSQNIEIINMAMRLIVKAAVLAAGFSGRARINGGVKLYHLAGG